ncbi:MAG: ABC transporter ATP-binding protein [Pseudomonadota bacterium]
MAEPLLKTVDLKKRFGGVNATDTVSLDVMPGECHAVIGPNGAGKTTLISLLNGALSPDSGAVIFDGQRIDSLPVHARCHLGLARSFQITSVLMDMPIVQNVALAIQARQGHSFRFWSNASKDRSLVDPAMEFLRHVGLHARARENASTLSHGERRQLEIAMALATDPKLLLLDEPMAGMGPDESEVMIKTLGKLKGTKTMLLVEHDMDAVFALADRISVLVYGQIIASGPPDAIRNDDAVKRAYLGDEAA